MTNETSAIHRKKQPELVRRQLLDSTSQLISERGLAAVSLQAIASDAGVTKGALFHHFENKEELVRELLKDMLDQLGDAIDEEMDPDTAAHGRFTRAFINVTFSEMAKGCNVCSKVISECADIHNDDLNLHWNTWYSKRMEMHKETDSALGLEILRFAASGIWKDVVMHNNTTTRKRLDVLKNQMLKMTHTIGKED